MWKLGGLLMVLALGCGAVEDAPPPNCQIVYSISPYSVSSADSPAGCGCPDGTTMTIGMDRCCGPGLKPETAVSDSCCDAAGNCH